MSRKTYCLECPHRKLKESYLDDDTMGNQGLIQMLEERMGDLAKDYNLESLFVLVVVTGQLEGKPDERITAKANHFLLTYLDERRKYDRYKDANKPK